jgi:AcrR family transcriptional regulator
MRVPNSRGSGENLRADLVAAAQELLLRPQAVSLPSLRAVARACSVSPTAVYLHFESQRALLEAVVQSQFEDLRTHILAAIDPDAAPDTQLEALASAYVGWGFAHPGGYQVLFESADRLGGAYPAAHGASQWELIDVGAALIGASMGFDESVARRLAFRVWAGMHGIVSLRLHKPDLDWPMSVEDELSALIDSLSAPGSAAQAVPTENRG